MFDTYAEAAAAMSSDGVKAADPLAFDPPDMVSARFQQDRYFAWFHRKLPTLDQPSREVQSMQAGEDLRIDGPVGVFSLRIYRPSSKDVLPVIVFVRGAGWWAGALDSHASTMMQLAAFSGCAVCGIDFHCTPEARYPVQRDELLATLAWLHEQAAAHGLSNQPPVLFGESAGATLCLSAALTLRDREARPLDNSLLGGVPMPVGLVLFYANAGGPKPTARAYSQWVWSQYLGYAGPSTDANAVPLLDDMHGMPPMWLAAGEDDPLMADTLALARKLEAAGIPHELTRYPGLPHGFVMWSGLLRPAQQALQAAARAASAFNSTTKET